MGTHQCKDCLNFFARSLTLKRHRESGVCPAKFQMESENSKDADTEFENSEESDMESVEESLAEDSDETSEDGYFESHESSDADNEAENSDDDEEDDVITEEEEEDMFWDYIMNKVYDKMSRRFQLTVDRLMNKYPNRSEKDMKRKAFTHLKPQYNRNLRDQYLQFVELMHVLHKDPIQRKIKETAKRLREDADYGYEESIQYAAKKRKYLMEKKLDQYDRPELIHSDDE